MGDKEVLQCKHHSCRCLIGPSLLAADLAAMGDEARCVLAAGADYLHLDVMDGHFVENISWGPPVIASLRKGLGEDVYLDCHMAVSKPLKWVQPIKEAGGTQYTFHIEACGESGAAPICSAIREAGMRVGVALSPSTPVSAVADIVSLVDVVQVMTVEPGFGGQPFNPNVLSKVLTLRTEHPDLDIEVDGGLSPITVHEAARAGANMIVAGSAVFKPGASQKETIRAMRNSVEEHGHGKILALEDAVKGA